MPARADPLSTQTNANVTPSSSLARLRIDELGHHRQAVPKILVASLVDRRLRLAELSLLESAGRPKRIVNVEGIEVERRGSRARAS